MFEEGNEMIAHRMQILNDMSRQTVLLIADGYTFRNQATQESYITRVTDPVLIKPILKLKKTFIAEQIINTEGKELTKEYLFDKLETLKAAATITDSTPNAPDIKIYLSQLFATDVAGAGKMLLDSNNYEDLLKKHKGIKELFVDNIYTGTTDAPSGLARDFIELGLYKHKTSNELVLVTNYALHKRFQNKFGLLSVGDRPNDCNIIILLGLVPAFIPEFKERLTEDEKNFFKLLTTPVKLYHERASAVLYIQIISTPAYDSIVRSYKVEKMRMQFKQQEERTYGEAIRLASRNVQDLVNRLNEAEVLLVNAEKEMAYYQAGTSKLEDAVAYILEHSYIKDADYAGNTLTCSFKVPLAQWDPEIAETILKGLEENRDRYELDTAYATDIKKFIKYLLIEQVAKYWLLAEFTINLENFNWNVKRLYWNINGVTNNFPPEKLLVNKAGLNPHMEYHSCVGSYASQIEKARQRKDLPGLVESILAPYKCWNMADGTVTGKMFRYVIPNLIRYNIPCIEYKGNILDIRSFFQKLEEDRSPKPEAPIKKKRAPKARVLGEALHTQAEQGGEDNVN